MRVSRALLKTVPIVLVVAIIAVPVYQWYVERPSYRYRHAELALARGNATEANRWANLLEMDGRADLAHIIRLKTRAYDAKQLLDETAALGKTGQALGLVTVLAELATGHGQPFALAGSAAMAGNVRLLGPQREQAETSTRKAYSKALEEYARISTPDPTTQLLAGECFMHLGRLPQAAALLEAALQKQPELAEAHRRLASIYYDLGAMNAAVDHLKALGNLEPEDGRPFQVMGSIHTDYQQMGLAIDDYRQALRRNLTPAGRIEVIHQAVDLLIEMRGQGNYEEALSLLVQCPEAVQRQPEFMTLRAGCLWHMPGREREASGLVDAALAALPDHVPALLLRAEIHVDAEQPEAALPMLRKAAALDPFEIKIHERLARACRQLGDRLTPWANAHRASQWALQAVAAPGPGHAIPGLVVNMSALVRDQILFRQAEEHLRRRDLAESYMEQLTKLHADAMDKPWDDTLRLEIAQVWLKMGRTDQARNWLRMTLACNPANAAARTALGRLTSGGAGVN